MSAWHHPNGAPYVGSPLRPGLGEARDGPMPNIYRLPVAQSRPNRVAPRTTDVRPCAPGHGGGVKAFKFPWSPALADDSCFTPGRTALPGNSKLEAPSPASPRRAAGIGNLKAPAGEQYFCRWQWLRLVLTSGRLQCYLEIVAAPAPAEPPGGARSPSPRSIASPAMGPG